MKSPLIVTDPEEPLPVPAAETTPKVAGVAIVTLPPLSLLYKAFAERLPVVAPALKVMELPSPSAVTVPALPMIEIVPPLPS